MKPHRIEGHNVTMTSPPGLEAAVVPIHARRSFEHDRPCISTAFKPDAAELATLNAGGHVVLTIMSPGMPPLKLAVEIDEAAAQAGLGALNSLEELREHCGIMERAVRVLNAQLVATGGHGDMTRQVAAGALNRMRLAQ
jgi:hypothetical protein